MSFIDAIKEREKRRKTLRLHAIAEAKRLVLRLRKIFYFDSIYIYGSILTDNFSRHSDIDMIIKGLKISDFFKAYALLLKESDYNIDLKPFEDLTGEFKKKVFYRGEKIG